MEGVLPSAHPWGGAEGPWGWGCWLRALLRGHSGLRESEETPWRFDKICSITCWPWHQVPAPHVYK